MILERNLPTLSLQEQVMEAPWHFFYQYSTSSCTAVATTQQGLAYGRLCLECTSRDCRW